MTVLEFWGGSLIAFGPALAMFSLTIAHDPIKVILLISSSFFWLLSFLVAAMCWAVINTLCDYLIIGAIIAVLSQEGFRALFHIVTKKAQVVLSQILASESSDNGRSDKPTSSRAQETQITETRSPPLQDQIPLSYVSGLGFGIMNGAFSVMNVLTDYLGPGTVGLKGDSSYFLVVSSLTALAFMLLNVSWSILMSKSIEKSDKKTAAIVLITHLVATLVTFLNRLHLQLVSLTIVYALTIACGLGAFHIAGVDLRRLLI